MKKNSSIYAATAGACTQFVIVSKDLHLSLTQFLLQFVLVAIIGFAMGKLLNELYFYLQGTVFKR